MRKTAPLKINSDHLAQNIRGYIILPGSNEYDDARRVYNAMIDRHPRLIVRCRDVADIIQSLRFAREQNLLVSVRSSGHGAAGHAVCDDGLVIDLSEMRSVRVDPIGKRAIAEPGVTWADFDYETQAFGLATPGGTVSSTSISGLTLGGGIGWLMGSYGLTCDNLLRADVITAEGKIVRATEKINSDLFWALRGGGGNFGVVSLFEFRLHEVVDVLAGSMHVPLERAVEALRNFRDLSENSPDQATLCPTFLNSGNETPFLSFDLCYHGSISAGLEYVRHAERLLSPEVNTVGIRSYLNWQRYLDSAFSERLRGYWKSAFFDYLSDDLIGSVVKSFQCAPSDKTTLILEHLHGQITRINADNTAYGNRQKPFSLLIATRWKNPEDDNINISWANGLYSELQHLTDGSGYLNYRGETEEGDLRTSYGDEKYRQLSFVKQKYDPHNLFRMNHNIRPNSEIMG